MMTSKKGRRPQIKREDDLKKMEDDLKKLNERSESEAILTSGSNHM
jgi:hypothetical protein